MAEIDLKNMEKLIAMMIENDLSELQYEHGELKIELKRGCIQPAAVLTATPALVAPAAAPGASPQDASPPVDEHAGLRSIESPMVGTFFAAPDPDSSPFVSVGTPVSPDTTVCLIEAMKVFNEIKAEISGTIEKLAVKNAEAVEYGQPLFWVRPN